MKQILAMFILINLCCVQNKIFIQEVYLSTEKLSEEEKQTLTFKKIEKCNMQELLFGAAGEFKAVDHYDKALKLALYEAFQKSNNKPWQDVKIYREDISCVILEGYYSEK
ncbi:MAG: hypothetical protein KA146_07030 [Leptospiraceae bacterium]|nr:hypothetical protein [Leptospiraceae bacterium]